MRNSKSLLTVGLIILTFLISCSEPPMPKPRGYFRIDMPKKQYVKLDSIYPFSFERSQYTQVEIDPRQPDGEVWLNIVYPREHAKIYFSYKKMDTALSVYIEDARTFAMNHISKARGIDQSYYENPARNVYGADYEIKGSTTASPYQFYLTDSTTHFIRASLYFEMVPDNDSLAPVITYIQDDIRHIINTFSWN